MREIVVIQLLLVDRGIWFTIVHVRKREDLTVHIGVGVMMTWDYLESRSANRKLTYEVHETTFLANSSHVSGYGFVIHCGMRHD